MQIRCPSCNEWCEVDFEPEIGQHLICPFCEVKFSYSGTGHGDNDRKMDECRCPHCGTVYEITTDEVGNSAKCKTCNKAFIISVSRGEDSSVESSSSHYRENSSDNSNKPTKKFPRASMPLKMYCHQCGNELNPQTLFCPRCGVAVRGKNSSKNTSANVEVPDHLLGAIVVTVFCCFPLGVMAIVFSVLSDSRKRDGDIKGALAAARTADVCIDLSMQLGIVGALIGIAIYLFSTGVFKF